MTPGRMMDFPLTLTHLLDRARRYFPRTEIVSRAPDGKLHRQTWSDTYDRSCKLAHALARLGVKEGDRVATLAWNHNRHLEAYYAVPMMGAIVHTLNLRLHPTEIGYIARHAEDSVVLVDRSLLPLLNQFIETVPSIRHVIVMADDGPTPEGKLDYERLLAAEPAEYDWPRLDENAAATICYTSGTTGNPKGVVYSHRSNVLHALVSSLPDETDLSQTDVVLPVVPMFHANCWGFAHMAAAVGASLVFPGPKLDPESLLDLMAAAKVTVAAGVPTIWIGILAQLDAHPKKWDLSSLAAHDGRRIGGAARHDRGVREAPRATGRARMGHDGDEPRRQHRARQGEPRRRRRRVEALVPRVAGVRAAVRRDAALRRPGPSARVGRRGHGRARGPRTLGRRVVPRRRGQGPMDRGRMVQDGRRRDDRRRGLRADLRPLEGRHQVGRRVDQQRRARERAHEPPVRPRSRGVRGPAPKWAERPIAAIVLKKDKQATGAELGKHLEGQFAKFWMPDAYVFVEQIPRTSTGKFLKTRLRDTYGSMLEGGAPETEK